MAFNIAQNCVKYETKKCIFTLCRHVSKNAPLPITEISNLTGEYHSNFGYAYAKAIIEP